MSEDRAEEGAEGPAGYLWRRSRDHKGSILRPDVLERVDRSAGLKARQGPVGGYFVHGRVLALTAETLEVFVTALRVLVGVQTKFTAGLDRLSEDGSKCYIVGDGWEGWFETRAVLDMEVRIC